MKHNKNASVNKNLQGKTNYTIIPAKRADVRIIRD